MSALEEVTALLNGETLEDKQDEREPEAVAVEPEDASADSEGVRGSDSPEEGKPVEKQTVKTLAERLGVKPSELYDLIEIGLPNDKVYSLGELKDLAVTGQALGKTKATLEKDATDLLVQRRELQIVAEQMSKTGRISQAEVDELRKTEEKRLAAEVQNFRRSVPSWDDPVTRSRELDAISRHVRQYGLSVPEFEGLVTDARVMKLVRDAAISAPEPKPAVAPRRAPARTGNTKKDTLSQIAELIR